MRPNRSIPDATVIPELAYSDVITAAKWLCDTFGFQKRLQIGNHRIQLLVGTGAIVVTERAASLRQVDFAHSVLVRVENVDQHYATAMAAGARIICQPQSYPFGERQYTVEDFEGHIWTFSQTIDDIDPASWGGILQQAVARLIKPIARACIFFKAVPAFVLRSGGDAVLTDGL